MSSTSNAQDLLVNVFRPTYTWDSNKGFVPAMVVSNVTEVITDNVNAGALVISDTRQNTYIGFNAGADLGVTSTASNVAIGVEAMAGATNSSNNVSLGASNFAGLSNATNNVGIGSGTRMGRGAKNIILGTNNILGDGSGNIILGNDLSLGNISTTLRLGSLIYGDLSFGYLGVNNPVPRAALDISGEVVFRNKVAIQKDDPIYTLDVAGSVYATEQIIGGKGTQSNPMYTFFDSSGSGMYVPTDPSFGTGAFAIAVNQKPAAIFSSNAVNFFQDLDVSGTFSARNVDISAFSVTDGMASKPSITFTNDLSTGLYLVSSNRLGVTTGGLRRLEVLSNGDVSYSGRIVGSDAAACNVIGGVTLQNGFVVTTGSTTSSKLAVDNGSATAPSYTFVTDPSSGFHLIGTSRIGFDTAGLQRMCISGGNVGIGRTAPVVALDVQGDVSATTYNGPGGTAGAPHFTSSDDRTTGVFFPGANIVGLTAGGAERMRISNGNIGIGTTTPANALDVAGTLRIIGTTGGDLTFSNGNINLAGVPVLSSTGVLSNATTTSNSIGGVTLSNTNITYAGAISNTNVGSSNQIGGVTLSNTNITYAGAISNTVSTTSNRIGGVTLSNSDISLTGAGKIVGPLLAANVLGGVTLCNNQVSNSSYTNSSQFIASSDGIAGNPGFAFGTEAGLGLYKVGAATIGVATGSSLRSTFSNGDFSNAGLITTSNARGAVGSQSAPTYSFTDDTNTGFYRFNTGQLGLAAGGATTMLTGNTSTIFCNSGARSVTLVSNQVQVENGSAAAPSLSFVSNTTTGMYLSATNVLNFATGGSNRMTFSNGNVGIGTTVPGTVLEVAKAGTGVTADLRIRAGEGGGASSTNKAMLRLAHRGNAGGDLESGFQTDYVGGNTGISVYYVDLGNTLPYVRFDGTTQRVGIGKMSPAQALDVSGDVNVQSAGTGGTLYVGGTSGVFMNCDATANKNGFIRAGGSTANLYLGTSNNNRMMIASGGNIGIGNTNPQYLLDISSATTSQGISITAPNAQLNIRNSGTVGALQLYMNGTDQGLYTTNSLPLYLYQNGGARLAISNSWIGIGTTTPFCAFDVETNTSTANEVVSVLATSPQDINHKLVASRGNASAGTYGEIATQVGMIFRSGTTNTYNSMIRFHRGGSGSGGFMSFTTTDNTERMRLEGSYLGIGTTNAAYALDVCAAATTASVNLSTWSRTAISPCHVARGTQGTNNGGGTTDPYCVYFSAPKIALDANLGVVTNDSAYGTYFQCKRSGIWTITFQAFVGAANSAAVIDVVSAYTNTDVPNTTYARAIAATQTGYYAGVVTYTGYLPSNTNLYYKPRVGAQVTGGCSSNMLTITFLQEMPSNASTWPV